jgi:hypothetical protein
MHINAIIPEFAHVTVSDPDDEATAVHIPKSPEVICCVHVFDMESVTVSELPDLHRKTVISMSLDDMPDENPQAME